MKHKLQFSIRLKLTLMLLIFTSGICLVFILMNRFFMKDYYVSNKKENLVRAYEEIDKIVEKSDTLYEYDTSKIITVCEKYGVPGIFAMGRKGGSNVAATICNALLYTAAGTVDPDKRWK